MARSLAVLKLSTRVKNVITFAAKRASYVWQYSTDQKTRTTAPATLQSTTGVSGLTAGTQYYFRVQPLTTGGVGDWSQTVTLIVK